jgi:hypothetical protein
MQNDESWENWLSSVLQSRPEPEPRMDIAAEALARGQAVAAKLARLERLARWTRVAGAAAAVLVVATVVAGYLLWPVSTVVSTTTETTSSLPDMTTVGITAFLLMVVAVALAMVLVPERQQVRLAL